MASRLESGTPIEHDAQLFERLYAVVKSSHERYPGRIWFQLFDADLQAHVAEDYLKPTERERLAANYLLKVLPAPWSLRVASVARGRTGEQRDRLLLRENCPAPLLAAYDKDRELRGPGATVESWRGVYHLLWGFHEESRCAEFAKPAIAMADEFIGGMKGKDVADVGAGSGPSLASFRSAIGPDSKLYAVEVDPFALDVLTHMAAGLDVTPVQCANAEVNLPEDSVDIIVMTGVHMGSGLTEHYEGETLPWLRTMADALRPNGILIIDDGDHDLLKQDFEAKVERAGFKTLAVRKGAEHPRRDSEWIAVFRVVH